MSTKEEEFLKRLQAAFNIEARESLEAMSSGLLELEKTPPGGQRALIETIFREAHSLKGAARAVSMGDVEAICQALESVFAVWKHQDISLAPAQFDSLHHALDVMTKLLAAPNGTAPVKDQIPGIVHQLAAWAAGGAAPATPAPATATAAPDRRDGQGTAQQDEAQKVESARIEADRIEADRIEAERRVAERREEERRTEPRRATDVTASTPETGDAPHPSVAVERAAGETVRIPTAKLDTLLLQVEEMVAIKQTANQRATDLRAVEERLEMWRKEWAKVNPELRMAQQARELNGEGILPPTETPAILLDFLDWSAAYFKDLENRITSLTKAAEHDQRATTGLVDNLLQDTKNLLMLPFATLLAVFPKLVRDLARDQGKEIELVIHGGEVEIDKRILEEMKAPLIHILRNCIDHGIEKPEARTHSDKSAGARISIAVSQVAGKVEIVIADDGGGIDPDKVRDAAVRHGLISAEEADSLGEPETLALIFKSEVSTSPSVTEVSGRGLGLAIVREKVEKLGGRVTVETTPGQGTAFRILLPLTLSTFRGILVEAAGHCFVVPTTTVERVVRLRHDGVKTVENRETIALHGRAISLVRLAHVLELHDSQESDMDDFMTLVLLGTADDCIAFRVDAVLDEQEVLVKSLGKPLSRVRNVAGATVLGSGRAVPILNVEDLMKSATHAVRSHDFSRAPTAPDDAPTDERAASERAVPKRKAVLIAEDSITSRMLLKNILEAAGYAVSTAVDGVDALTTLRTQAFDIVISDVDMPRMNGFDLIARIRNDDRLADLPAVLVTGRDTREDRERGIDVGANAYVVKSDFNQSNLLDVVQRLV